MSTTPKALAIEKGLGTESTQSAWPTVLSSVSGWEDPPLSHSGLCKQYLRVFAEFYLSGEMLIWVFLVHGMKYAFLFFFFSLSDSSQCGLSSKTWLSLAPLFLQDIAELALQSQIYHRVFPFSMQCSSPHFFFIFFSCSMFFLPSGIKWKWVETESTQLG